MKHPNKKKALLFCTGMLAWSLTACGIYGPPEAYDEPSSIPGDSIPALIYGPPETFEGSDNTGSSETQTTEPPADTSLDTVVTVAALYGPPPTDDMPETIPGDEVPEDIYGPPEAFN